MKAALGPRDLQALRLIRHGNPVEFVSIKCRIPVTRVRKLRDRQRIRDRERCQAIKTGGIKYERVETYVCPVCERMVFLRPCVACVARGDA